MIQAKVFKRALGASAKPAQILCRLPLRAMMSGRDPKEPGHIDIKHNLLDPEQ
jgi:hypothetical protein